MKWMVCVVVSLLFSSAVAAQQVRKPSKKGKTVAVKKKRAAPTLLKNEWPYTAKAQEANRVTKLQISDSLLRTFNARAAGFSIPNVKDLPGVPRGTYGFANGKILLYSNTATSSGTIMGSGAVGTGTSPAGVGTSGPSTGINGKNPYAGFGPYGTRLPYPVNTIDTIQKQKQ